MSQPKNNVFLLLGGNLEDVAQTFSHAVELIEKRLGMVVKKSSLYESPAWGFESAHPFLNQVLIVATNLGPNQILDTVLKIESELGRIRNPEQKGYSSRVIDIDLLYFNDEIIEEENLEVPHPRLHLRKFTLLPLVEVAPDFVHPLNHLTQIQLLENCQDSSEVSIVK